MTNTAPQKDFKPTFIPWYETDFRADRIVQRMTPVQRSFYRNLLLDCYFGEQRPYLTADDSDLWLIAEAGSLEEWLATKTLILTKFIPVELKDGKHVLSNKRVLEEWARLEHLLKQKQNAGLASAMARRAKAKNPPAPPKSRKDKKRVEHITTDKSVAQTMNERSTPVQTVGIVGHNLVSVGQEQDKSEAEIMAEFQQVMEDCRAPAGPFDATKPHREAGIKFYKQFGRDITLAAWREWLLNEDHLIKRDGKPKGFKSWLLNEFISNGHAETYANHVRPLVAVGAAGWKLDFLYSARDEVSELNPPITKEEIVKMDRVGEKYFNEHHYEDLRDLINTPEGAAA